MSTSSQDEYLNNWLLSFQHPIKSGDAWKTSVFGRRETAAVIDPSTKRAATVTIRNGTLAQPGLLNAAEIQKIHKHFKSHAKKDLALSSTLI
jgi:hypothetical protein